MLFNENAKILLAEKFVNVEFLIPFLHYNFTAKEEIEEILQKFLNIYGKHHQFSVHLTSPNNSIHQRNNSM